MKKNNKQENIEIIRHSLSHILAAAVKELWPKVKFAIGPAIENGFYYDFDFGNEKISDENLKEIEKKMIHVIKKNLPFKMMAMEIDEAVEKEKLAGQIYKQELAEELKGEGEKKVNYYDLGGFIDLCRGPHLESSGKIKAGSFKLTKIAGAYWRGDEKNKMLTRIYGLAFEAKEKIEEYLKIMEEAEKRDHKKLGRELDLFSFHSESPGCPFWHPKGMIVWNELEKLGKGIRKKYGYLEIQTPILAKSTLWEISGHWDHYKDSMFHFKNEDEILAIKPMDCPFNIKIYQERQRSYRELPVRYTEIGRVMRNEKSGELNGLLRVRSITQDDSHVFLTKEQVEEEISILLKMAKEYYKIFNLVPDFSLSTRPDDFMGEIKDWDIAEKDLANALKKEKINFNLKEGDGAFYGPKIDIGIKDAIGREWQLATIQLDFQLPQRFDLEYVGKDGQKKTPVMIHAAIFGSFERFIGIILEHYAGTFPLWLAPVQVKILSVGESHIDFCKKLAEEFENNNIRAEVDDSNETVGNKIRKSAGEKIPYVLVVGDKEVSSDNLAVRERGSKETKEIAKDEFIEDLKKKIKNKE